MAQRWLMAVLAGLGAAAMPVAGQAPAGPDWRAIATPEDRARLRGWRAAWTAALASAGQRDEIAAEGPLLEPDAARGDPAPPPGPYRCRTIKLGTRSADRPALVAYPPVACRIARDGDTLRFAVLDGAQRPAGRLFRDRADVRLVFLGAMRLGDERAQPYGRDAERDMIGALERIGPARWRLVLPSPRWESLLDVIELVPER